MSSFAIEPGRFVAGDTGVLLTEVIWVKPGADRTHLIVDAAMKGLARPALYDACHEFVAVRPTGARMVADIAGPVCESGDPFATGREIDAVRPGDLAVSAPPVRTERPSPRPTIAARWCPKCWSAAIGSRSSRIASPAGDAGDKASARLDPDRDGAEPHRAAACRLTSRHPTSSESRAVQLR